MRTSSRLAVLFLTVSVLSARQSLDAGLDRAIPHLLDIYRHLHANPELSYHEVRTSSFVARELRALGFNVTERVGRYEDPGRTCYGVVAVMRNGAGPTVLVRTDLDALPMEERTGLPYASTVKARNEAGEEVSVMHACGHDMHMTVFLGTARLLSEMKSRWTGTLVMIAQPSEERGTGARAMLRGGLYTRFPRPDFALALHNSASLPAGTVGVCEGYALASVNSVDITVRGVGGHGAYPHTTKDPIVLASQIVLALQTIVSREVPPLDDAVVTVGSIHGGTKHNIIPDEVRMQLTVRSYKEEVQRHILSSIRRIAVGLARAAGIPEDLLPIVTADEQEATAATYNDPALTQLAAGAMRRALGDSNVVAVEPVMGAEDFGAYDDGKTLPLCLFWLGTVDPAAYEKSVREGTQLPSLHSSQFAPLPEPTIRTGVKAMTSVVMELMRRSSGGGTR